MSHQHQHQHQHQHEHEHHHQHGVLPPDAATGGDMTTCPVMIGSPVVKSVAEATGLVRDHKGRRYWLCCAACGPMFDADPDRYATAAP